MKACDLKRRELLHNRRKFRMDQLKDRLARSAHSVSPFTAGNGHYFEYSRNCGNCFWHSWKI